MCGRSCIGKNLSTHSDERILLCAKIRNIKIDPQERIEAAKALGAFNTVSRDITGSLYIIMDQIENEQNADVATALKETASELANTVTPDMCACPLAILESYKRKLAHYAAA